MAFDKLPPIPSAEKIMDGALKAARNVKAKGRKQDDHFTKQRKRMRERFTAVRTEVNMRLNTIARRMPSIDELSEFYRQLINQYHDTTTYRKQISRVQNTSKVVSTITKKYRGAVEGARSVADLKTAEKQYLGRVRSTLDRIDKDMQALEKIRLFFLDLPPLKDRFTVCVAGFPNVGKSTLVKRWTDSNVEIQNYAFTTKRLNVAHRRFGSVWVQFIDTPGTLNRDHMNAIEMQAHLALKYVADLIVYVYDATEPFPLADQEKLHKEMSKYGAKTITLLSKQDLLEAKDINAFMKKHDCSTEEDALQTISDHALAAARASR